MVLFSSSGIQAFVNELSLYAWSLSDRSKQWDQVRHVALS